MLANRLIPYGSSTAEMIQKAFVTGKVMKLCKSYRSTFEISNFAQRIQANEDLEAIARHGDAPTVLSFKNPEEELSAISGIITTFKKSNYKSLGIICKTEVQAQEITERLKSHRTTSISSLSPEYGFRQRNYHHLIPHGEGVRIPTR